MRGIEVVKAMATAACTLLVLPGLAGIIDFNPAGNDEFKLTYPDQFRYSGAAAVSSRPVVIAANLDDLGKEAVITNRPVVFRVNSDIEFTGSWTQSGGTFLKTGPGAMRFNFDGADKMNMIVGPCCTENGKSDRRGSERFVLPDDGSAPAAGFNGYTIYEGKLLVNARGATSSNMLKFGGNARAYFNVGDWIAGEGEQEPDVEFVVESGYVNIPVMTRIGTYHGFKDYNTPAGRAKSQITVKEGATIKFSGGVQQYLGAHESRKFGDVYRQYNQKNVIRVEKGGYYNFESSADFNVNTQPGCDSEFDVDGGKVYCPNIYHSSVTTYRDGERNFLVNIRNGGTFANLSFRNCVINPRAEGPCRVDVRIANGGVFATEYVTNGVDGTFTFHADGGTLATFRHVNTAVNNIYSSSERRDICEKILLDASIEGLYVSGGGVRVVSTGRTVTDKLPHVAVLAAPIMPDADLPDGVMDGGVTVAAGEAENGFVFAAKNSYHGPTVLENGIVTLRGEGDFSDSPVSVADAQLRLTGGDRTLSSLKFTGRFFDLCLGPDAVLKVSGLDVGDAEGLLIDFCDTEGVRLSNAQTERAVLVFPTSCRDAVSSLRVGMRAGSSLGIKSLNLVDDANGFTELRVTAVPVTEPGVPAFADGFFGMCSGSGDDYALQSLNADAASYKPGVYVVARYKRNGEISLLDNFSYPQRSMFIVSFKEELVVSGEYAGFYEVKMVITEVVPQSAIWTDGVEGDHSMASSGNWEQMPTSLTDGSADIKLKSGQQMDVVENARVYGIENKLEKDNSPFVIDAADHALAVDGLFKSDKAGQLILKGRIMDTDGDASGYVPAVDGTRQITYLSASFYDADGKNEPEGLIGMRRSSGYWGVPLVLDGAVIGKPVYADGVMGTYLLYILDNTVNVIDAPFSLGDKWVRYFVGEGSMLEFKKGLSSKNQVRLNGNGKLRITDVPYALSSTLGVESGTLTLDAEGCRITPLNSGIDNYDIYTFESSSPVTIECLRSYCFKDGTDSISLENYLNRPAGGSGIQPRTFNLHATTQIVQRIRFVSTHADSRLTGDEGALLVVNGGREENRNYKYAINNGTEKFHDAVMTNMIQTIGGLGFKLDGADERLVLAGQNFESTGVLEASAGTLELAADATWLNGVDFKASGEGCLAFHSAGQINRESAVLWLSENGKIDVPSGVTLKVSLVMVKNGDEWVAVSSGEFDGTGSGLLQGCVTGGGKLRIGKAGLIFTVR